VGFKIFAEKLRQYFASLTSLSEIDRYTDDFKVIFSAVKIAPKHGPNIDPLKCMSYLYSYPDALLASI
jgi:hypothetical protein